LPYILKETMQMYVQNGFLESSYKSSA